MCGFVGYINKEKKDDTIKKMGKMIEHRGPDDENYYIDNDIALAFRRLSIIDLKNGRQPMTNEDESIVVVFNGEIYNFQSIREILIKKGHTFKTNSDTEVLVHGYEEYGKDILKKLRGMFAFVVWDKKEKQLFGARDYFGIKPFYYTQMGNTFMFGSEIKSFIPNKYFNKQVNKKALKTYLTFQYSALDETFFKGVYRLKPGHCFTYKDGKLNIEKYFDFKYEPENKSLEEFQKIVDDDIKKSVKYHRISDVKVGAFLSGGVDSSYVVSVLKPDKTYSVGFDYAKFNETNYAKELSDLLKIKNQRKLINADEFFEGVEKVQYYSDEPHANLSAVPLYFLSQMTVKDVKVVQSGEGADELYGGYDAYYQSSAFKLYKKLPFKLREKIKNSIKDKKYFKGQGFLIKGGTKLEDYYIGQAFIFDDEEANSVLNKKYQTNISFKDITKPIFDEVKDLDEVQKMQYLDMHLWLPNDILLKADKITMANSLELRVPFLDIEVFKNSLKIPTKYKIGKKLTKIVLRKASELSVPEEWAKRPKKGFPVPFSIWLKEDKYYNKVKEVFESDYAKEFFDTKQILELLDKHYNNIENTGRKVYTIYAFLVWYKEYFIDMKKARI